MPIPFLVPLLVGVALQVIGYLLMAKAKTDTAVEYTDQEEPTAETGKPIPMVFGSLTLSSPNNLGWWDKETLTRDAASGGKK